MLSIIESPESSPPSGGRAGGISYLLDFLELLPYGAVAWTVRESALITLSCNASGARLTHTPELEYFIRQVHEQQEGAIFEGWRLLPLDGNIVVAVEHREEATALRQEVTALENFSYDVSHDLQGPMRRAAGFSELLARRMKQQLSDREKQFLSHIIESCKEAQSQIQDLLIYSRVSSDWQLASVSFDELAQDALKAGEIAVAEVGGRLTVEGKAELRVDVRRVRQALQLLLDNAVRYRHAERTLEIIVRVEEHSGGWRVSVIDNGRGVPEGERERVFRMFRRGSNVGDIDGHGAGLAVVERITMRHGGSVSLTNRSRGGTSVTMHIPRDAGALTLRDVT